MVRVYGPAMSLDASGTLANTITFSKWKGRNYVRERVIPSNPQSGAQTGRRAMFKFLSQAWSALPALDKATWQGIADGIVASPFNAYMRVNMANWHNFLMPSTEYPATRAATGGTDGDDAGAVWVENRIRIDNQLTALASNWGSVIFASLTTGFSVGVGTTVLVERVVDLDSHEWYWTPPSVATWYFGMRHFSADGKLGGLVSEFSAVP